MLNVAATTLVSLAAVFVPSRNASCETETFCEVDCCNSTMYSVNWCRFLFHICLGNCCHIEIVGPVANSYYQLALAKFGRRLRYLENDVNSTA